MRTRGKLLLLTLLAGGAAVVLRGRQPTPAPTPAPSPASEPFMGPSESPTSPRRSVRPADAPAPAEEIPHPVPGAVDVEGDRSAHAAAREGTDGEGTDAEDAIAPLPSPPHGPFTTTPDGPADDLKRISGIGPKLETLLNEQGITTFAQLAALDEDDIDALQARLPEFPGRIRRDAWVAQATRLRDAG